MRVKINLKAGGVNMQHNQTIARRLRIKSNLRAGGSTIQHNQAVKKG